MTSRDDVDVCSSCRKPRQTSDSLAISQRVYVCNCDRTTDGAGLFEPLCSAESSDKSTVSQTSSGAYHALAYQQLEFDLGSSGDRPRSWLSRNATAIIVLSTIVTIFSVIFVYFQLFGSDTRYDAGLSEDDPAGSNKFDEQKSDDSDIPVIHNVDNQVDLGSDVKFGGFERTEIPSPKFIALQNTASAKNTLLKIHLNDCTINRPDAFNKFSEFPNLEGFMILNSTGLTDEAVKNICESMPSLTSFCVEFCDINGSAVMYIARLKKLEEVYLRGNRVDDDDIKPLFSTKLLRLDIGKTQVTDAGLSALVNMKTLQHLRLVLGDGITNEGVERFKQRRPDVKIKYD